MARPREDGLTAREMQIIEVIWELGEARVEDIRARLSADLAGSTLRTLLAIMEDKGYVAHTLQGKAKVFRALVDREQTQSSALQTMVQRLFKGSADLLLARLVEDEELSLDELDKLRRKIRDRQRKGAR